MKPPPFAYYAPSSVDEAIELLATIDGAKVLAGGQSLIPLLNMRLANPTALIDISRLVELSAISVNDGVVRIGAAATHEQVRRDSSVAQNQPLIADALGHVAHTVIRNRGTTVGSLVHADPAAEMPAVLTVLGGSLEAVSERGRRTIDVTACFPGPLESGCASDELVVAATFPVCPPRTGTACVELARRHGDYALAGVVAVVSVDSDNRVTSAAVSCLATEDIPRRYDLTVELSEQPAESLVADAAVARLRDAIEPDTDIHATADYRRHLVGILTSRALHQAATDATRWRGRDD